MNADIKKQDTSGIDLGWMFIEGTPPQQVYKVRDASITITHATYLVAAYLRDHQGESVPIDRLKTLLGNKGFPATTASVAINQIKNVMSEFYNPRKVAKILDRDTQDFVTLAVYDESIFGPPPAQPSEENFLPDSSNDNGESLAKVVKPVTRKAKPAPLKNKAAKDKTKAPGVQSDFTKAHDLPARLDTGVFVIDYQEGRKDPARINGGENGVSTRQYAAFYDIYKAQGDTVAAKSLGDKHFAQGRNGQPAKRPEGTAYAAVFHFRGALSRENIRDAETLVETVTGKGFRWTGPKSPSVE